MPPTSRQLYRDTKTLISIIWYAAPPTELDRRKIEEAWRLRLLTNSALCSLLMRMIHTKPEDRPSIREILKDPYFGDIQVGNDVYDSRGDQAVDEVDSTIGG